MPQVVVVAMTVDIDDPEQAVEFVRAELLSRSWWCLTGPPSLAAPTRSRSQARIS